MNEAACILRVPRRCAQSSEHRQHAMSKACRGTIVVARTMTISYYWSIRKQRLQSTRCHSCQPTVQPLFCGVEIGLSSAREETCTRRVKKRGWVHGIVDSILFHLSCIFQRVLSPLFSFIRSLFAIFIRAPSSEEPRSRNSARWDIYAGNLPLSCSVPFIIPAFVRVRTYFASLAAI